MSATMTSPVRRSLVSIGLVIGAFGLIARGARADQIPTGWTASHMTVVGHTGLQGRGGAEKLAIKAVNGRWYLDVSPPFGLDGVAVHDVLKIPGQPLLLAHSESIAGDSPRAPYAAGKTCEEPLPLAGMVDLKNPAKPRLISLFPVPVPPATAPYRSFCDKGGRFGPHNTNLGYHLPDVEHRGDLVYLTYFNAGVRIVDIKNPRRPKEVAWFIPPTPTKRYGPIPDQLVTETEDVLVDRRGNIYITDKQWGIWVVRQAPGATSLAAPRKKAE